MSRAAERARSAPVTAAVLAALTEGPKTNIELSKLSPTVNDHIGFLRTGGHEIECQRREGGVFLYTLRADKPPQWSILVEVKLRDGTITHQHMVVDGWTGRQAKSKARNFAAKTRILQSTLLAQVTGNELHTDDQGH